MKISFQFSIGNNPAAGVEAMTEAQETASWRVYAAAAAMVARKTQGVFTREQMDYIERSLRARKGCAVAVCGGVLYVRLVAA